MGWENWFSARWDLGINDATVGPRGLRVDHAFHPNVIRRAISIPFLKRPLEAIPEAWESVVIEVPAQLLAAENPLFAIIEHITVDYRACPFASYRVLGGRAQGAFTTDVYIEAFT